MWCCVIFIKDIPESRKRIRTMKEDVWWRLKKGVPTWETSKYSIPNCPIYCLVYLRNFVRLNTKFLVRD